jgi:hypothetical protein
MKKNFDQKITDLKGIAVKDPSGTELTAQMLVANALLTDFPDEKVSGEEKFKRFKLALAVTNKAEVDLKPEQLASIKTVVGKAYTPLIVGRLFEIIDA